MNAAWTAWVTGATQQVQEQGADSASFDLVTELLRYGLLGLIFLCILFRKFLVPEWTLKTAEENARLEKEDLLRRLAEAQEQLDKLQDVFQDQMIPALTRATEINARYNEELQRARYKRRGEHPPPDEGD